VLPLAADLEQPSSWQRRPPPCAMQNSVPPAMADLAQPTCWQRLPHNIPQVARDTKSSLGDTKSLLGDAKSSLGGVSVERRGQSVHHPVDVAKEAEEVTGPMHTQPRPFWSSQLPCERLSFHLEPIRSIKGH
jgi:hypothetical protein